MHYTRFERARIVGARALQISMGAPILVELTADLLDPLTIALREFEKGILPLTVKREIVKATDVMRVR